MILPEAQLYGGNILETQVMELTRYYLRPRGTVAKIVPGKSLPGFDYVFKKYRCVGKIF